MISDLSRALCALMFCAGAAAWSGCSDLGEPPAAGCLTDLECRGDRICDNGRCVFPPDRNNTTQGDMGTADMSTPDMSTPDMGTPDMHVPDMGDACPASAPTRCGDVCVNTNTNPNRCGDCAVACSDGWGCANGQCVPPPPSCTPGSCQGLMWCNTDAGRCEPGCESSAQCPTGQSCNIDHVCECPEGTQACDAGCCLIEDECLTGTITGGPTPFTGQPSPISATVNTPLSFAVSFSRQPTFFEWALAARPSSSSATLNANGPSNRRLTPDRPGTYIIEVTALDERGAAPCAPIRMTINVTGSTSVHDVQLQLLWDTPNDPDQSDMTGTDMDLHYLRPNAVAWDVIPGAIFWRNVVEDWGMPNNALDDPSMDIDDTDGQGPENINHPVVAEPGVYRVGVNYYNSNGFGESTATLKVFINGQLTTLTSRPMVEGEFWFPLSIVQPGGMIQTNPGVQYSMGFPALTP